MPGTLDYVSQCSTCGNVDAVACVDRCGLSSSAHFFTRDNARTCSARVLSSQWRGAFAPLEDNAGSRGRERVEHCSNQGGVSLSTQFASSEIKSCQIIFMHYSGILIINPLPTA